jgi:putative glutamine amidotransferase
MSKPKIGIPLGMKQTTFSRLPHYAMEQNYFDAITKLGGIPIAIPYETENFLYYISMIDGILLPGGSFSSPNDWYLNETPTLPKASMWSDFYEKITETSLSQKIPILAICAGMQFLACKTGGKMTVDIHTHLNTDIDHLNGAPKEKCAHHVTLNKNSKLYEITGLEKFSVNSAHTEAVISTGEQTTVSANCMEDGCIEALEIQNHPFAIGVQWHPEFFLDDTTSPHYKIMKAFINATKK